MHPFDCVQLVQKWKEVIAADPSSQPLVNVVGWFSRASLDIIGEGFARVSTTVKSRTNRQQLALTSSLGRSITERTPCCEMIMRCKAGMTFIMTYLTI